MKVKQFSTGTWIDDKEIIAIELNPKQDCFVRILTYGAIIQSFVVINKYGEQQNIVLGFDTADGYLSEAYLMDYPYLGTVIGRYANRIKNANFCMDSKTYTLAQNNDGNCIHGGREGFDKKHWTIQEIQENDEPSVTLSYLSKAGEEGFPGNLHISIKFTFTSNLELILEYKAFTDFSTPINLTHHGYFNLNTNKGSISNHFQMIAASNILEQDSNWCATGKLIDLNSLPSHDFRMAKTIGQEWDPNDGYDQSYVLDKAFGEFKLASQTYSLDSGLILSIKTTEPIAHFYTAKYLSVRQASNGINYNAFEAFCVETQHHPNAINIPDFPNTILHPGEIYRQTTSYQVSLLSTS